MCAALWFADKKGLSMPKQAAAGSRRSPPKRPANRVRPGPGKNPAQVARSWITRDRARVIGMLAVGFALGVALSSPLKEVVAGRDASSDAWQYGRLGVGLTGANWSTADRHHAAEDLGELAGKITNGPSAGEMTPLQLVNFIADRGWELVSVSYASDPRDDDRYWFRRSID